jgi:hypothetical protein
MRVRLAYAADGAVAAARAFIGVRGMSVRDFELYHGAVLSKVLRSQRPAGLRLVETRKQDARRKDPTPRAEKIDVKLPRASLAARRPL